MDTEQDLFFLKSDILQHTLLCICVSKVTTLYLCQYHFLKNAKRGWFASTMPLWMVMSVFWLVATLVQNDMSLQLLDGLQ